MERNSSKKRDAVLAALSCTKAHPTAEMLYADLKPMYPELSLATVYRNLSVLMEEGRVISVGEVNGKTRYDACVVPHTHFVCRCCGRVYDVELPGFISGEKLSRLAPDGFGIEGWELRLQGICPDCAKQ